MVESHEMDSHGGCVRNSGGHIITYLKKRMLIDGLYYVKWYIDIMQ